jgi:hypothetical protein
MPKKMEKSLKKTAKKKFPGNKERQDRYVYRTMIKKTSWRPKKKRTCKRGKR